MRVITGSARGRKLLAPEGFDTRPTTDLVKEAICSAVQFDIPCANVLDLFAGSGQIAIEALSRGAAKATLIESNRKAWKVIEQNIATCGFSSQAQLLCTDAISYLLRCHEAFDIAFLDPPYRQGILPEVLPLLLPHMQKNGVIICEHEPELQLPEKIGEYPLKKRKKYGRIFVSIYRGEDASDTAE